jgi:hypothetical protein
MIYAHFCHHQLRWIFPSSTVVWLALVGTFSLLLGWYSPTSAQIANYSSDPPANCRFGVDVSNDLRTDFTLYNTGLLHAGWQMDWMSAVTPPLAALEYVNTIGLQPRGVDYTASPTGTALLKIIATRPGAMWLVGNEPDCTGVDNLLSGVYARAYHDVYYRIKAADPTARIGAGSIVQPTPLRFHYLNNVLDAYQQRYHEPLPADFWSTHGHILSEVASVVQACQTPDWPNGSPESTYYSVTDHWRLDIFAARLLNLRRWMADHGYRDRPLLVPEYGILLWHDPANQKTVQDDLNFMTGSFDWLRTATDPQVGYPADGNRLVQRWAWFSLTYSNWALPLFDPSSYQPTIMANTYGAYTAAHPPAPASLQVSVQSGPPQGPVNDVYTVTLTAQIANAGDLSTTMPINITFLDSAHGTILDQQEIGALSGCGATENVHTEWQKISAGLHPFCVRATTSTLTHTVCSTYNLLPYDTYLPILQFLEQ